MAEVFVALDRLLAIAFPVLYRTGLNKKLLIVAFVMCTLVGSAVAFIYTYFVMDPLPVVVAMIVDYVDPKVIDMILVLQIAITVLNILTSVIFLIAITVLNILTSVIFLVKLQKFNIFLDRSSKVANTVVFYQIILATVFWLAPYVTKAVVEYGFGVLIRTYIGQAPTTSVVVYVAGCSVLYWKKLAASSRATTEIMNRTAQF
uniref:G_PROTEIN_RECEP_F1_2 domain-containing protein n=1 Tax=Steinernema glaseri TaxID=37863 RepID=A0A1I7YUT8_9BILA